MIGTENWAGQNVRHFPPYAHGAMMCHHQAIHDGASCSQSQSPRFRLIFAVESYKCLYLAVLHLGNVKFWWPSAAAAASLCCIVSRRFENTD
jgi:hypothetical protein